jgi:hypothetical protein
MRVCAFLVASLLVACQPRPDTGEPGAQRGRGASRMILPITWTTELDRCFTDRDSIFYPSRVRRAGQHVWVNDVMAGRVVQLTADGQVVRYIGQRGSGPGEFQATRALEFAADGRIVVWDPLNSRLSYIDTAGAIEQVTVELATHAEQFVPLADGGAILLAHRPDSPLVRVDAAGRRLGRQAMPWPRFATLAPLAAQQVTVAQASRGRAAVGLLFGEVFFLIEDGAVVPRAFEYVEAIPAPEIRGTVDANGDSVYAMPPMVITTGLDLALTDRWVVVLFGGRSDPRHRLLDFYDRETGRYVQSVVLPHPLQHFTLWDGAVIGIRPADYACLRVYRPEAPYDALFREGDR